MKIFITGCAKSGTTLLRRLFQAFNVNVAPNEMSLEEFIKSDYDVAKRNFNSILSNKISPLEIAKQRKLIFDHNIKIVNITRNRRDVLNSQNGYVKESRYNACVEQFHKHRDLIDFNIEFEKLIREPDKIQWELVKKFVLMPEFMFSDYPNFIDPSKEQFKNGNYSLRKLGEDY